jgi:hypothetical protein
LQLLTYSVNIGVLGLAALALLSKFITVDADYWTGWTIMEILSRVPADNWHLYEAAVVTNPIYTKVLCAVSPGRALLQTQTLNTDPEAPKPASRIRAFRSPSFAPSSVQFLACAWPTGRAEFGEARVCGLAPTPPLARAGIGHSRSCARSAFQICLACAPQKNAGSLAHAGAPRGHTRTRARTHTHTHACLLACFLQACISGVVYSLGDLTAQTYEGRSLADFDLPRAVRSGICGFVAHGPLSHCYYVLMDNTFSGLPVRWA